ncbi:FapA family protein [Bacillus sp. Marseille-P3661]|uniref:FapA family protein n=1 Tax=Bacillus sp. Marseille-P3661 TaxID=1936234 RepID=UPI000C834662|nr:FapA family protein [Bacillus sp. Marseille-P3661]
MKESLVFKGKTVEEAIETGLAKLGLALEDVTIEILNEGKKSIFMIGQKEAKVRLIKKKNENSTEKTHTDKPEIVSVNTGKVWVENGLIHCEDPDDGELIVHIPPMVMLYKNNELIKEQGTISEKDVLRVEFISEESPTKWAIEKSSDNLEAKLIVEPGSKVIYSLVDQQPVKEITLKTTTKVLPNLTLSPTEIHGQLKKLGITFGIQQEQIDNACLANQKGEFVIARGTRPTEGKNGWLEYKVEMKETKYYLEREDGSIDYREGYVIPQVKAGIDIAYIHEPIEGVAGTSLSGEMVLPKVVSPILIKLGNGTAFKEDDKNMIISTSIGRPSIEKRGMQVILNVVPKLEHNTDVNMATGNIKFIGDILISGNVEENMCIIASGDIEVKGTTSNATIKAGQSVVLYSNVISSEIVAGNSNKIIAKKSKLLKEISGELSSLQSDLHQISKNPSFSKHKLEEGIMPLIKLLIQTKNTPLITNLRQFIIEMKKDLEMLDSEWQTLITRLHQGFLLMDPSCFLTTNDFDSLVDQFKHLIQITSIPVETGTAAVLPSAMNSDIYSAGDVIITKQGCYNTIIYALGKLEVKGFIRGGRVYAGMGTLIDEAGSKGGASTLIIVPYDQTIKIKNVLADTTIQIGKKRYTFTKDISNIAARIDENGELVIH